MTKNGITINGVEYKVHKHKLGPFLEDRNTCDACDFRNSRICAKQPCAIFEDAGHEVYFKKSETGTKR